MSADAAKILVVDDERDICLALAQILRREGYQVQMAQSAEEALRTIEDAGFDLVLTDLRLPGSDGLALLHQIRSRFPDTRLVLVTASSEIHSHQRAFGGAIHFLAKPLKKEILIREIRRALTPNPA